MHKQESQLSQHLALQNRCDLDIKRFLSSLLCTLDNPSQNYCTLSQTEEIYILILDEEQHITQLLALVYATENSPKGPKLNVPMYHYSHGIKWVQYLFYKTNDYDITHSLK